MSDLDEFLDLVGTGKQPLSKEVIDELFSFMAFITIQEKPIIIGAKYNPSLLIDLYKRWENERRRSIR